VNPNKLTIVGFANVGRREQATISTRPYAVILSLRVPYAGVKTLPRRPAHALFGRDLDRLSIVYGCARQVRFRC
jgi:hypothetical protein